MSCERPKKLELELYLAGELDKERADQLKTHIEDCRVCEGMLEELRKNQHYFLSEFPFRKFAESLEQPDQITWLQRFSERFFQPALAPVYAVILMVFILVPVFVLQSVDQPGDASEITYKGKSDISFLYRRAGIIHEGNAEDLFMEGDEIQIHYMSAGFRYMSLFSIDAAGVISFYDDNSGSEYCSESISPGKTGIFPGSIILDDTSGGELILALFSSEPVKRRLVKRELAKAVSGAGGALEEVMKNLKASQFSKKSELVPLLIRKTHSGT